MSHNKYLICDIYNIFWLFNDKIQHHLMILSCFKCIGEGKGVSNNRAIIGEVRAINRLDLYKFEPGRGSRFQIVRIGVVKYTNKEGLSALQSLS